MKLLTFAILFLSFTIAAPTLDAQPNETRYVRIRYSDNKDLAALQTAIVRLRGNDGLGAFTVDLISAVHIGEESYYKVLNNQFKNYDALLFELVAPPDIPRAQIGTPSDHPLSMGQKGLQNMLGLAFQLEEIDYKAPNFIHADMSPEQFSKSMLDRGESVSGLMMKMMMQSLAGEHAGAVPNLSDVLLMTMSKHRTMGFRRMLARQFESMDGLLEAINGKEGSTILTGRNAVAITVAKQQLALGKRKLGIFYGGAHLPDMETRLVNDLHLKRGETEWLDAWKL